GAGPHPAGPRQPHRVVEKVNFIALAQEGCSHSAPATRTMDITYKLLGTDGQQYGPVNLEQLQTWLREGRVSASSQVMRSDGNAWQPASAYTELGLSNPTALPTAAPAGAVSDPGAGATEGLSAEFLQLHRRIKSGGSWFYW